MSGYEFPWDMTRALEVALYRGYCVPSISALLDTRMGIREIPESYEKFQQFAYDYERDNFRFADTNQQIATATRDLFASWMPRIFTPLVRWGIYALLDDAMLASFGFPRPFVFMRKLVNGALKMRGWVVRMLPARRTPNFFTDRRNRTYPRGYEIAKLGPPKAD